MGDAAEYLILVAPPLALLGAAAVALAWDDISARRRRVGVFAPASQRRRRPER